jgi:radical SAM protein with 4Fe4S-binding SPASM domain
MEVSSMKMVQVTPNSNFTSLGGGVMPENASEEYLEYRRCWTENPKGFILRDMPMHLDIEASSRCNLRCTFCDKLPNLKPGQLGNIDMKLFCHIIDQFDDKNKLWGLKLSYRGEPLLSKEVPDMVRYAKEHGVLDVYFNTNGMLLDENMSRRLIEARLDRISISIDGTTASEYEGVRLGAKFDTLVNNLETLIRLKREYNVSYPKIRIQTVKFPNTDADAYRAKWEPYADEIAMIDYKDESIRNTGLRGDWACPQLWQRLTIEWDGTVLGCNNDDPRNINLGNAWERSIRDCWHDKSLTKIRELHMRGKSHEVEDCNGCPWRTAQLSKELCMDKRKSLDEDKSVEVNPNSNISSLGGGIAPDNASDEYRQYRRCWDEYPRKFILRDIPLHLDIEATSHCNLKCSFCDRQILVEKGMLGSMDMGLFRHIMDQFDENNRLWGVKFSYRGEPLINPNIPEMIRYAKQRGVLDIYFNTNAMLLTEDKCRAIIEAGLDRISFSIDGVDKQSYEAVRIGAYYDVVVKNIETLLRVRGELKSSIPKIRIQTVKLPGIDSNAYVSKWAPYADEVAMLEYTDETKREKGIDVKWACPQLWQRLTIEWDGSVFACNNDSTRGLYLGNAAERSIYDCWHDERLMKIRELHSKGRSCEVEACDGCPWRTAQIRKNQNNISKEEEKL